MSIFEFMSIGLVMIQIAISLSQNDQGRN